ncbi:hypothetical protein [Parabacteroides sp. PF5-9]|uniref:hypothetical protein n=1 Tax=Parabacteroides sp. PF5-9 TaxID=1742404 RepID=UPI0024755018|nr:hypothetical protein [Parabacteroides sp. PF5-9]MDH6358815.1 hypothetical protein [Parabacteroides sp. PF5-9]
MDNIGDWLYIVFILVAALSGLISSGKKKRQQTTTPDPPYETSDSDESTPTEKGFWEIWEEMQQKQSSPPPSKSRPATVQKKTKKTPHRVSTPTTTSFLPKGDLFDHEETPLQLIDDSEQYSFADENFQNADELRKAVIYTEILNRKY